VALEAVVNKTAVFQKAKSKAVKTPPRIGKIKLDRVTLLFLDFFQMKNGKRMVEVILRR